MKSLQHDYNAAVQEDKKERGRSKATGAQVVTDNIRHFDGYAKAGASLRLAAKRIAEGYAEDDVKASTVAREFNRVYGSWKKFRSNRHSAVVPSSSVSSCSTVPPVNPNMPHLNDDRVTGGLKFGAQS